MVSFSFKLLKIKGNAGAYANTGVTNVGYIAFALDSEGKQFARAAVATRNANSDLRV